MVRNVSQGAVAPHKSSGTAANDAVACTTTSSSVADNSSVALALLVAYVAAAGCMCRYVASTGGSVTFALTYFVWFTLAMVVTVHRYVAAACKRHCGTVAGCVSPFHHVTHCLPHGTQATTAGVLYEHLQ